MFTSSPPVVLGKNGQTRVLIVEDDRDQAEGLADLLESRGYPAAVVDTVAAAREAVDNFDPRVALIDLRLGDESGLDLVRELRESRPELLCVIVTAYADLDNTVRSVQCRVFDFLRKPLAPATLLACLDRCAEQISLRDAKREAEDALRRSTKQLEQFNCLAVGREQRIVELKQEVNQLCQALGRAEPFDSAALAADDTEAVPLETPRERESPLDTFPATVDLAGIVDLERIRSILDGFCDAVGIAAAIVDLRGEVLVQSRWQSICTDFHRVHDLTRRGCIESDTELSGQLAEGRQYAIYQCRNGLTDAASPIVIGDRHVANAFVGQFFVRPPDEADFRRQAAQYGFNERDYLAAMRRVPIVSPARLPAILGFLTGFSALLAEMGLERLRQDDIRRTLTVKNREFQAQRQAAISLAEDAQIARLASEQASEALRQSEARFCSFMENLPIIAGIRDSDGRMIFVNRVYARLLDMRPEDVIGKRIEDIYPPEQAKALLEHDADVLQNKRPRTFSETVELRGDRHFFLTARFPIPSDSRKEVKLGFIALDVTEQKRAEDQLRRERDFSKTLVETSPTFFVAIDPDGKTVMMNDAMLAALGYGQEEVVGKDYLATFVPEADRPMLAEVFGRLTRDKEPTVNENRVLTREGRAFPVEWHGGPVRDAQGNVEYFFGVGIDITERRRAEREREALIQKLEAQNAELERFAYSVSHDLKSPLITIQGFLGILRENLAKQDTEAVEHDLTRISNAAGRMERLLGDVLELSRIGRLVHPSEHVPLADLAREAVKLVEGRIHERRVDVHIAPDLPVVFGDRSRLLDVMQNLIDNAAKYMGDQPKPRVEIGAGDDRGETVCFVRDNGMGLEPHYFETIFGLFEQLNPKMEGTGIGLALVKRIIELHGGRIWVDSAGLGRGSTFFFTLPASCESEESV